MNLLFSSPPHNYGGYPPPQQGGYGYQPPPPAQPYGYSHVGFSNPTTQKMLTMIQSLLHSNMAGMAVFR
jgi:hypothetical protein